MIKLVQVRRDPRGAADDPRGARAGPAGHARLHDRVRAGDRAGRAARLAGRLHRPRRAPADLVAAVRRPRASRTGGSCCPTAPVWAWSRPVADRLALFTGGAVRRLARQDRARHPALRRRARSSRGRRARGRPRANEVVPYARRPVPIVAGVAEAVALGANVLVIGVAPFGGALTAEWRAALLEAIAAGMRRRGRPAHGARRGPGAGRGGRARGRRAARPARGAAGPERAAGRERPDVRVVHTVGSDCAIGKMSVTLELDAAARARGLRVRVRRHGPDRDRDRRLGDRGRPRDLGLRRRRGRAARAGGRGARAAAVRRGPGRARAPGLLAASRSGCCTAAGPTRWCSATARERPRSTTTRRRRSRRCPSSSRLYERAAGWVRPARVAAIALNTRGLDDDEARGRDRRRGARRPACPRRPGALRRRRAAGRGRYERARSPPTSTSRCATARPRTSGRSCPPTRPRCASSSAGCREQSRWLRFFSLGVEPRQGRRVRGARRPARGLRADRHHRRRGARRRPRRVRARAAGPGRGRVRGRRRDAGPRARDGADRAPRAGRRRARRHDVHRDRAAREPAHDQRLPRVGLPGRGARVAGRHRARVPDRARARTRGASSRIATGSPPSPRSSGCCGRARWR